ncbi:hypothetical protein GCM10010289_84190 [Streptomyces violascens]|nr:hypothetical protein GCM10010289_84190 [Streptomyces violascens]
MVAEQGEFDHRKHPFRRRPPHAGSVHWKLPSTTAYLVLTRERRELTREWVGPLREALHRPLGWAEQTDPRQATAQPTRVPRNCGLPSQDKRASRGMGRRMNRPR